MKLFLHSPNVASNLARIYKEAFTSAVELFVVSAYLTDWDSSLKLNPGCKRFRVIIGKDFGITRKLACEKVRKWLPKGRKSQFMVADNISGFHPKAMFWTDGKGRHFSLIGSSNLTRAAFEKNYEANTFSDISSDDFADAKRWVKEIEKQSVVVSEDWLEQYIESKPANAGKTSKTSATTAGVTIAFELPKPPNIAKLIAKRRKQLQVYKQHQERLLALFRLCATGKINSEAFFGRLPSVWSANIGNRLQGAGFERRGKVSDFRLITGSFLRIFAASDDDRDDVVVTEIDALAARSDPARGAFLSEMLCLAFPTEYPVLNKPVREYLRSVKFRAPRGASEGARYLDLSKKLRSSLLQNPKHPAKNIAELDTVLWRESELRKQTIGRNS